MVRHIGVVVLLIAALSFLGYRLWERGHRQRAESEFKKAFEEGQASQEIVCDACGATTTGLVLDRNQCREYQLCPKCAQKMGRPIVYYVCGNPECNQRLVKTKATVRTEDGRYISDPTPCPTCGRVDTLAPDFCSLAGAQEIADKTGQDFP